MYNYVKLLIIIVNQYTNNEYTDVSDTESDHRQTYTIGGSVEDIDDSRILPLVLTNIFLWNSLLSHIIYCSQ